MARKALLGVGWNAESVSRDYRLELSVLSALVHLIRDRKKYFAFHIGFLSCSFFHPLYFYTSHIVRCKPSAL